MTDEDIYTIESAPPEEVYRVFTAMLNRADPDAIPSPQTMIERMLLHNVDFQSKTDKLMQDAGIPGPMQRRIKEAFEWKRKQLQTRAKVFGNVN